mgnify:CR=1 FL=1
MSTLVHSIQTITADSHTVQTRAVEIGGLFVVECNGDEVGHPCSGLASFAIEPGDTWEIDENAVAFAEWHAEEHFKREARL